MTASNTLLLVITATWLWGIPMGASSEPATMSSSAPGLERTEAVTEKRRWFCTTTRCSGASGGTPLSQAASFGGAVLAVIWLARRTPTKTR